MTATPALRFARRYAVAVDDRRDAVAWTVGRGRAGGSDWSLGVVVKVGARYTAALRDGTPLPGRFATRQAAGEAVAAEADARRAEARRLLARTLD